MRQPVKFGKYLLLDRISVGGMAEVFKAKTFGVEGFEKIVAVKRILPAMGKDQDFIDMFIDEAKIAGQLAHANIGQIHELGKVEDAHFIAMEFIWGRDLLQVQNRFKKQKKRLSIRTACFIVMKICEGLHYAHKKRDVMGEDMMIVHRDCSPQNVVISFEGEVKLIDFGIAKAASRSAHTTAGVLKGKFGYMSPEQVRGLPLDRRTDVFSLGTILFESVTGRRLFHGESDFTTLEKVRNAIIERHHLEEAGVPKEVQRIICKTLERNAENRYQWCAELRDDLHAFLQKADEVYTNRTLGEEMHEMFANELLRERELMDLYSQIDVNGVLPKGKGSAPAEVLVGGSASQSAGLASGSQPRPGTQNDGDFEDSPTEIFGEFNLANLIGNLDQGNDSGSPPAAQEQSAEDSQLPDPQSSTIEIAVSIPTPTPTPTSLVPSDMAARSAHSISDDGVQPFGSFSPSSAVVAKPSLPIMPTMEVPKLPGPAEVGVPSPGVRRFVGGQRSKRDIVLGVVLAIAIILVIFGIKTMFLGGGDSSEVRPRNATLVVLGDDKPGAEVFIDDTSVGIVPTGDALTIDTLAAGVHKIRLMRSGSVLCESSMSLDDEKVKVFNCNAISNVLTTLAIDGLEKGDSLLVDGRLVSSDALAKPLVLTADVAHVFIATREGNGVSEFKVKLEKGAQSRHMIQWPPVPVHLDAGMEVMEMEPESLRMAAVEDPEDPKPPKTVPIRDGKDSKEPTKTTPKTTPKNDVEEPTTPVPTADTRGYFTAWSRPWARIHIDGKDTGKVTPVVSSAKISLAPGTHKVTFVVGSIRHEFSVQIKAGKTTRLAKILD